MTGPAAVVARWWASVRPHRQDLRADALAGLTGAVASVPDGMASSVLAGVNPIYGLHASMAAPWAGGLATSTRLMVITTTGAAALAAGSALEDVDPSERPGALFLLALLAGVLMLVAGVLHLGRYTRFVSHSVMTGFLMGVAINIVAGQIPDLTGAAADGRVALAKAFDVVTHPGRIDPATLATGLGALALLWVAGRVRPLEHVGSLLALAVPTAVVLVTGASVARVDDAGPIPGGLPLPALPEPDHFTVGLVTAALSIAAIVLVQGVGVAEVAPNGDGRGADVDRDFVAQGVANVASGLWQGLPVGGSVGQTAINASAGARSRWAAVLSGVWMLVILVAFSGAVGRVALPTLAAVLIYAGIGSLRFGEVEVIWRTGPVSQVALATTLLATLLLPVTAAVGIGVALSLLLQINQEAVDLTVVRLVPAGDGRFAEVAPPERLPLGEVTVLDVYGSLYYAGSRTLQARLPRVPASGAPVVVLRLRGRTAAGATFFLVMADYAQRLRTAGGRLYLSGVAPDLAAQIRRAGRVDVEGPVQVFPAQDIIGASTADAETAAETWLVTHRPVGGDADAD